MTLVSARWQKGECRIEDGLFFADDSFVPLEFDSNHGVLRTKGRCSLPVTDGWTELASDQLGEFSHREFRIRWGAGSWEGEGWIAVEHRTGDLQWILHLSTSEPFRTARIEDGAIVAIAREYPFTNEFRIDILAPETASVKQAKQL